MSNLYYESSLSHYGVRGQKWGVRRYQTSDGRWTHLGRQRNQVKDLKRSERDKTDRTKARLAKQKEKLKYEQSLAPDEHPILDSAKNKAKKVANDTVKSAKIQKARYDEAIAESNRKSTLSSEDKEVIDFAKIMTKKYLLAASVDAKSTRVTKEQLKDALHVRVKDIGQDFVIRVNEFKFR